MKDTESVATDGEVKKKNLFKNLRTGEIAEEITYIDELGYVYKYFSPNIDMENGDILTPYPSR